VTGPDPVVLRIVSYSIPWLIPGLSVGDGRAQSFRLLFPRRNDDADGEQHRTNGEKQPPGYVPGAAQQRTADPNECRANNYRASAHPEQRASSKRCDVVTLFQAFHFAILTSF